MPLRHISDAALDEALDKGALMDMGWQVSELTQALLTAPKLPGRAPDVVFFDLFGLGTVKYTAGLGWAMLALAGIALGVAANLERKLRAVGQGAKRKKYRGRFVMPGLVSGIAIDS